MCFARKYVINEDIQLGNWWDKNAWSDKAKFFELPPERRESTKATVENALVEDVYLCIQPYIVAMQIALNKTMINSMRGEIQRILAEYGGRDILYVSKTASLPAGLARGATELSPKIFLASEHCTMPLGEFLLFYKGGYYAPAAVMEEWTGMNEEEQALAYDEIVKFIRRTLETLHKNHQQVAMSS